MNQLSDRDERLSRRRLLERTGVTAGALALGGTALVGIAGGDVVHELGGPALAEGTLETNEVFKLRGPGDAVELEETCLTDESAGVTVRRYGIDYCAIEAEAELYVQPGEVQPQETSLYVMASVAPCTATDRSVVSFNPAPDYRDCFPRKWK